MRTHDEFTQDLEPLETDAFANDRRKKARTTPTPRLCYDWMIVSGNCHYARDRGAFRTYRPVAQLIKNNIFNPQQELAVAGVGTVELQVCRTSKDGGRSVHTIVLEDVLHIPEAVCNGFNPLLYGSSMSCTMEVWEGADRYGEPVWFAVPFAGGTRLVLAGEPRGESELIQGMYYTLSLSITPQERREILGRRLNDIFVMCLKNSDSEGELVNSDRRESDRDVFI
ncbi:uncharacterized protein ACLA_098680 [Aspergillus clavatus NRRL 1]|uniref:Retrovirus-related Pol polyprotein from transposon TNT 1-94-like beta-barrel domain-containing protein n=1 Tax=Aspergillus clavatus (strain ATCC 1007 / CBS 513.65 / DSM 816 / NCTC 3887 / NRRL 1 / QM 1276 / 107) TaxID=344612 RepID=A1CMY9_ASPCL|nr:uncharacterized protein ACLA_098680 [Aspergillus clavatus NRRL 1]EAW08926.1 conserved hypothetical protein [Aspergillus clavatus NRRL 1]